MLAKLSKGNQITLPKKVVERAHLKAGTDYVEVEYENGRIYLKPVDIHDRVAPEQYDRLLDAAFNVEPGDLLVREDEAKGLLARRSKKRK